MTVPYNYNADIAVASDKETLNTDFFNKRYSKFDAAIRNIDGRQNTFDGVVNTFVTTALAQLNTLLGPMLTNIQSASTLGFLWAKAIGNPLAMVLGQAEGFRVTENASLFTPTPVLLVQDLTDSTNWALVTLDSGGWTPSTGDLATHCVYTTKTQASSQWFISCSAAIFPAMLNLLNQVQTARAACDADVASVAGNVATVNGLVAAVQAGPVVSVAGKTGAVTLVEGDISGLVSDLANKVATSTYTTGLAGKENASPKLDTLAAMNWTANQLLMATSTSALGSIPITTFMQAQLNMASAAAALANLAGAPLASPALTGTPSAPTAATTDNSTTLATTAFVHAVSTADNAAISLPSNQITAAFNDQTGTTYTFVAADYGKSVTLTNAAAITATLPNNLAKGWNVLVYQGGAGAIAFTAAAGATLRQRQGNAHSAGLYAVCSLLCVSNSSGTNAVYVLGGDTVA